MNKVAPPFDDDELLISHWVMSQSKEHVKVLESPDGVLVILRKFTFYDHDQCHVRGVVMYKVRRFKHIMRKTCMGITECPSPCLLDRTLCAAWLKTCENERSEWRDGSYSLIMMGT
jgi:hypothetical protein